MIFDWHFGTEEVVFSRNGVAVVLVQGKRRQGFPHSKVNNMEEFKLISTKDIINISTIQAHI